MPVSTADHIAISDHLARYCWAVDEGDEEGWIALWTEDGVFTRIGGWALVALAAALFLSAQNGLLGALHPPAKLELVETKAQIAFSEHLIALAQSTLLASPLIVLLVGFFGDALAKLATEEATAVSRKLAKHASKLALLAGALALPVLLWVVYLRIVSWGLQCNMAGTPCAMSLAEFPVGEEFTVYRPAAAIGLAAAILLAIMRLPCRVDAIG